VELERTDARFETTRWTLIDDLAGDDDARRAAAREMLAECYWPAVYAWLRRSGRDRGQAAELTQAFFAEVVLARGLFERAERDRGRLRTLVLTALQRFLVDHHRRACARRDGMTISLEQIEHEESIAAPARDAESAFDRRWALSLLEAALRRCEDHYRSCGRARHWALFEAREVRPALGEMTAPHLADLAHEHGFATPADAASAVQVVKARAMAILREVVGETVPVSSDLDTEMRFVMTALG